MRHPPVLPAARPYRSSRAPTCGSHAPRPYLERVHDAVQELDDEERRYLTLDDGHEEDLVAVDAKEVVVRRGDHRRHVLRLRGPLLRLKEIVADGAANDALPVLLQEDVPRGVDQE